MSVSLYYATLTDVPPEIRAEIIADATEFGDTWEPWCEGITIYESDDEEPLEGSTKLFSGGSSQGDVEDGEDFLMTALDIETIAGWMQRMAARHHLVWALNTDGDEIGQVDADGPDDELLTHLDSLAEMGGAEDLEDARSKAAAIRQKHTG